jgi:hypothetical protein
VRSEEVPIEQGITRSINVHPSGRRFAYNRQKFPFELLMMDMPRPATGIERLWRKWILPEPRQAPVSEEE